MTKQRALHAFGFLLAIFLIGLADHLQHSTWALAPAIGAIVTALLVDLRKVFGGDLPGPPAVVALLVALALSSCSGCWLTKPPPVSPTAPDGGFADASSGQTFVDCSDVAMHKAVLDILPAVETGLATGAVAGALAAVGISVAAPFVVDEVACACAYLIARITHSQKAAPDDLEKTKLANAQAWLAQHPNVTPQHAGTP